LGEPEPAPDEIDPYEVAFLTGGECSVIVVAAYKLLKQHVLRIITTPTTANRDMKAIVAEDGVTAPKGSPAIEIAVLEYFREGRALATALELHLPQTIHVFCQPYSLFLKAQRLLAPNEVYTYASRLRLIGSLVVFVVACYAAIAIYHIRPDLAPSAIAIGFGAISCVYRFCHARRVTARGEAYLAVLRREALSPRDLNQLINPANRAAAVVSLFGWNRLHDADDAEFRTLLLVSGAALTTPSWRSTDSRGST